MTARYRFGPLERRGLVAGWRGGQVASAAVGLSVAVVALRWRSDGLGLAVAALAVGCSLLVACWPVRGSTLEEWAPVVVRWGAGRALGSHRHVSQVPLLGSSWHTAPEVTELGPGARVPGPFRRLHLLRPELMSSGRSLGVIHDASAGAFIAVLAVGGGAFALLGHDGKEERVARYAGALAGLARDGSAVHRIQWVQRTLPEGARASRTQVAEGAQIPDGHPALRSYRELIASTGTGLREETFVAVSVSAARAAVAVRAAGGGIRGACTVLARELLSLERRLRAAGLQVDGVLGARALAGSLCHAVGVAPGRVGSTGLSCPWPVAMDLEWSRVRFDGAWHATYWVAEWPRVDVGPDFLAPAVLQSGIRRTFSVTMEPIDPVRAAREVERARTADLADAKLRRRGGFTRTARRRREEEGLARRESELADGHAQYRFSGYVTVTADDIDELEAACSETELVAAQARLELRRLYGDQDRAFTYTLPLCRGLS